MSNLRFISDSVRSRISTATNKKFVRASTFYPGTNLLSESSNLTTLEASPVGAVTHVVISSNELSMRSTTHWQNLLQKVIDLELVLEFTPHNGVITLLHVGEKVYEVIPVVVAGETLYFDFYEKRADFDDETVLMFSIIPVYKLTSQVFEVNTSANALQSYISFVRDKVHPQLGNYMSGTGLATYSRICRDIGTQGVNYVYGKESQKFLKFTSELFADTALTTTSKWVSRTHTPVMFAKYHPGFKETSRLIKDLHQSVKERGDTNVKIA